MAFDHPIFGGYDDAPIGRGATTDPQTGHLRSLGTLATLLDTRICKADIIDTYEICGYTGTHINPAGG